MSIPLVCTDGGKDEAGFPYETRDCAVRALAIAADLPYGEAHARMRAEGRKNRRGTKTYMTERALAKLKAQVEELKPWHYQRAPLAEAVRTLQNGRYLVIVRGHALAICDGTVYDAGDISGPRCRVRRVWKITPPEPTPQAPKQHHVGDKTTLSQEDINTMWERLKKIKF